MPTHHALAKKKTTRRDEAKTLKKLLFHVFLFFVVVFFVRQFIGMFVYMPQWAKVKKKAINMDLSPCLQAFQLNSIKSTYILFA